MNSEYSTQDALNRISVRKPKKPCQRHDCRWQGLIELKIALGSAVKQRRQKKRLTQTAFAKAIASSQSRVAKMEAGDPSVSLDLLVKSMLSLGATRRDVATAIAN